MLWITGPHTKLGDWALGELPFCQSIPYLQPVLALMLEIAEAACKAQQDYVLHLETGCGSILTKKA